MTAQAFVLRAGTPADHAAVLALNNASVPHVNALDAESLGAIVALSAHFVVATDADGLLGFVLCIPQGCDYWSENYRWFSARHAEFLYLDRVAIAPRAQRRGVGRALYADLERTARGRWPRIALEVNLRPPNPVSLAFHEAMGFLPVGVRDYGDGAVQMFLKELT